MMAGYEALYVRTTGESFLDFYRSTRLGQSIQFSDPRVVPTRSSTSDGTCSGWRGLPPRGAWCVCRRRGLAPGQWRRDAPAQIFEIASARGIQWGLLTTAVFIAVLSPALVRAERFIFPSYFIIGAMGVVADVAAVRPGRQDCRTHRSLSVASVLVWLATFLLSLGSKVVRL